MKCMFLIVLVERVGKWIVKEKCWDITFIYIFEYFIKLRYSIVEINKLQVWVISVSYSCN